MKSKTSFYNRPLARNYWRRFWPLPLAVLLTVLIAEAMPVISWMNRDWDLYARIEQLQNSIFTTVYLMLICMAGASFLTAALVFHHLHSRKEIQFYHGLPVRRPGLYGTAYCTGLLLIALPLALGLGLCMLLALGMGAGSVVPALCMLLLAALAALLIFYGLAVLACVLAGQTFGALLIYVGMNCAALIILGGAGDIAAPLLPGIDLSSALQPLVLWLTPLVKLMQSLGPRYDTVQEFSGGKMEFSMAVGFAEILAAVVYAAVGLALGVLSGWLYRIRRSERAGEMVAFGPVRTLSKIFGALMICAAGSLVVLNMGLFPEGAPFWAIAAVVLAFGFLGWIAGEMVVRKTLRVFGKKPMLACCAFLLVLLACLSLGKLDPLGRVEYVPEAARVQRASISFSYSGGVDVDPADAIAVHNSVLAHRELLSDGASGMLSYATYDRPTLSISYELDNGRTLSRSYRVRRDWDEAGESYAPNPVIDPLETLLSKPDYCYQTWFSGLPQEGVTEENLSLASYESYGYTDENGEFHDQGVGYVELDKDAAVKLFQYVREDIQLGNLSPRGFEENNSMGYLVFQVYEEPYDQAKYGSYQSYTAACPVASVGIEVTPAMSGTVGWLTEIFVFHSYREFDIVG